MNACILALQVLPASQNDDRTRWPTSTERARCMRSRRTACAARRTSTLSTRTFLCSLGAEQAEAFQSPGIGGEVPR
jgi:hypothetical protein